MTKHQDAALLAARILLAALFIVAALGKLANVDGFTAYMVSGGVPAFLAWPVILFELLGGLALLVGWMTRPVALLLAGFSLLTGLLFHFVPADQLQMTIFFKNVAMTGGYLAMMVTGPGRFSLDARTGRGASHSAA